MFLRRHPRLAHSCLWARRRKRALVAWWQHNNTRYTWKWRTANIAAALLVVAGTTLPLLQQILSTHSYELSYEVRQLVGKVNPVLSQQLLYSAQDSTYRFNALPDSTNPTSPATLAAMRAQLGAASGKDGNTSTHSLTIPTDWRKGVTYTDTNTKLRFTLTPQSGAATGQMVDGHLVFPLGRGTQAVYTLKNNGLKEDIILDRYISDTMEFAYTLNLPEDLTAKIGGDGSLGIYSPNPMLFGDMAATDDKEKILSARATTAKDHLLFVLPAPVIIEKGGRQANAPARFSLDGNTLTVTAEKLKDLSYPLSIDPSVVVTSSNDFATGNNEHNIDYSVDGQITRGGLTGGNIGAWVSTGSGSMTARTGGGSAVHNGYVYWVGGRILGAGTTASEVTYASINSNGTLGTWNTTTSLPTGRSFSAAVPYNGKMYVYGGYTTGTVALDTVLYADINSNGTLGSWQSASTTMNTAVCRFGSTVYGGYLYAAGGATGTVLSNCDINSSTMINTLQYAPILPSGDVGAWTTSANTFTNARKDPGFAIYNGYAYMSAGMLNGSTIYRDTQIAKLGDNGDIGTWRTSSVQTPVDAYAFGYQAYNGYLYLSGGTGNMNSTLYAPIYAHGDIGAWRSSSATMATGRWGQGFVLSGDYAYYFGGHNGVSSFLSDTGYAKIDEAGVPASWATTTALPTSREYNATFAYNSRIYSLGGATSGTNGTTTTYYASLNASGTTGSWSTTNTLNSATAAAGVAVYNGYVYLLGGYNSGGSAQTTVQYALINTNGTLGTWQTTTSLPAATAGHAATAWSGYLYMLGSGTGTSTVVRYAQINPSNGTIGAWNTTTSFGTARSKATVQVNAGYLYVYGGGNSVEYAKLQDNGTIASNSGCGSAWCSGPNLPAARYFLASAVSNGYLYAIGGEDSGGTTRYNTVYFAPLGADGSVGAWQTGPTLPNTVARTTGTVYNSYFYTIAGRVNGSLAATSYYAAINNGGSGTSSAATWTAASNDLSPMYPNGIGYNNMFTHGGYLYVVGGIADSSYISDTWSAPLLPDGSVGTWIKQTSMPTGRSSFVLSIWNSYVYACMGTTGGGSYDNTCTYAQLQSGGGLGAWSANQTMNLPSGTVPSRAYAAADAANGYLYVLGGSNASTVYNTVYYAPLDPVNGSVGTWQVGTSFATARTGARAFVTNGYLYLVGGSTVVGGSTNFITDVSSTLLSPANGSVGAWLATSTLVNTPLRGMFNLGVANGYVYIYGGTSSAGGPTWIEQAPILPSGHLGTWERIAGSAITTGRASNTGVIHNGYIYLSSGRNNANGGTFFSDIQYSPLNTIARTARYSKQIDLATNANITGITYNGTESTLVMYRAANLDGVYGALRPASSTPGGSCREVETITRQVWISAVFDDTTSAVFPDSSGTRANLTDLTISYNATHPEPNIRLRGGKTLQESTGLTPLDTCQT